MTRENDRTAILTAAGQPLRLAALVLAGGQSKRMGTPKALLPFGGETMLQRVVRLLGTIADPIVVVLAADQEVPAELSLARDCTLLIARDQRLGRGPLEGLAAGLTELGDRADLVYATACDAPLLEPAFPIELARRLALAGDKMLAGAPREDEFLHPLATVYRPAILPSVQRLLAADRLRPTLLFDEAPTLGVPVDELRSVDPELHTLWNLNSPEEYQAALRAAGLIPHAP